MVKNLGGKVHRGVGMHSVAYAACCLWLECAPIMVALRLNLNRTEPGSEPALAQTGFGANLRDGEPDSVRTGPSKLRFGPVRPV